MTPILTPAQEDLLITLIVADRNARARLGESDRFAWHRSGGMGPTELLHRGAEPGQTIDGGDMEALIGCGLLQRTGQRAAVLTPEATRLGLRLEGARGVQVPVEVTWAAAEPVLQALWDTWASLAGPPLGAPLEEIAAEVDDEPTRVERLLELLEENGWAKQRAQGDPRSGAGASYAPTSRAMQRFGGWPATEEGALHGFVAAIEAAVEESERMSRAPWIFGGGPGVMVRR